MGVINRPIYGERGQKKAAERRFPYNALNAHKPKSSKNAEIKMRKSEKELSRSKQIYTFGLMKRIGRIAYTYVSKIEVNRQWK